MMATMDENMMDTQVGNPATASRATDGAYKTMPNWIVCWKFY